MIVDPKTLKSTSMACIPLFCLQLPAVKCVAPYYSDFSVLPLGPFDGLVTWEVIRKHMCISIQNFEAGRWWTLVTHILAHKSVEHFINNAIGTFFSALGIISEHGIQAFYGSYFMGAAFGGIATFLEYHWNLRDFLKSLRTTFFGGSIIKSLGRKGFEYYNRMYMHVGSSTSVSGLMGFSAAKAWYKLSSRYKRFRRRGMSVEDSCKKLLDVESYFLIFNFLQLWSSFAGDLLKVTKRKHGISKLQAYSADSIGHAGHLGGFIGGVVFYNLFHNANS